MDVELIREGADYVCVHLDGVVMRFRRVRESHEDVTALVRISLLHFPERDDGDLFDAKLILTGPRSKADARKACEERVPEFDDWYAFIEHACQLVRRALEDGTPIIRLNTVELPDHDEPYVIEPILRRGENALVFGPGGAGKSILALWWATLANERTLYLDYEDEATTLCRRLRQLTNGTYTDSHVYYKRAEASVPAMADALARQIAQEGITGLIVDSAGQACGLEPEAADSANAYFRALRTMGIDWSLTIAHQPKGREKNPHPFGSVYWWNNPRTIWQIRREQEEETDHIDVGLWHVKSNNGRLHEPLGYRIAFTGALTTVARAPVRQVPAFREHLTQGDRIEAALEDAQGVPLSGPDLAARTGIPLSGLYKVLSRHRRVAKVAGGYVLADYA